MVSTSSNRSPSPMSSRTQQEREGGPVARKSFTGYPIGNGKPSIVSQPRSFNPNTPANSPAEYGKRGSFRDHEQKENERDHVNLKPIARPRSPSVSKGCKNFMSPTISAASKIIPSPRRKVLGDRNEAIRTSASLSDGKFQFFSTMSSLEFSNENEPIGESEILNKNVNEFSQGEGNIELEPDLVVLSPDVPAKADVEINVGLDGMIVSDSSPSPIAPLDSDLSFAPYDPKTNFLSPRPQFLCYKPNPRIESYINNGLSLEDQLASETSSEIESSGETQSENLSQEQEEDSFSFSSSSVAGLSEHPPSFESNPSKTHKRFFTKWKTLAFVLVFMLGFVAFSVTYNPSLRNAVLRDEVTAKVYHDLRGVVDLAQVNFDGVFQRVKLWSARSVDHLSQIIHNWREVNTFRPVLYSNLTDWQEEEDYLVGDFEFGSFFDIKDDIEYVVGDVESIYFVEKDESFAELQGNPPSEEQELFVEEVEVPKAETRLNTETEEQEVEENYVLPPLDNGENSMLGKESSIGTDFQIEDNSEVPNAEMQSNSEIEEQEPEEVEENFVLPALGNGENSMLGKESSISTDVQIEDNSEVPKAEMQSNSEIEEQEPEEVEEDYVLPALDHGGNSIFEKETNINDDFQIEDNFEGSSNPAIPPQIPTTTEPLVEDDQSCPINLATEEVKTNSQMVIFSTPKNSQLLKTVSLVALLILTVAAAFMYLKPKNTTTVISAIEKSMTEKSVAKSVKEPSIYEVQPSFSGQVEVDNMMSEPCLSEMSSFQKTSSQVKRGRRNGTDEAQSQSLERKRESLASSSSEYSMFSSSYGSFTTYSKVPSKKGDEKVVTPVRRSSRLRSQV